MADHHSAALEGLRTVVLVPIRSFRAGKSRLQDAIGAHQRAELARSMAERVVAAAKGLSVWVVTDDPEVAAWATQIGATAFDPDAEGLNPAVTVAAQAAATIAQIVLIAHADLPDADDLRPVAVAVACGADVAVAPDRRHDGSNVMAFTAAAARDFTFRYGPGSCAAHLNEAADRQLRAVLVTASTLAFDLDDITDLDEYRRRHPDLEESG